MANIRKPCVSKEEQLKLINECRYSGITYTMVEMAKAHNLNIYGYLSYILEQRPDESWNHSSFQNWHPEVKNSKL